jgi:hypothetical protein
MDIITGYLLMNWKPSYFPSNKDIENKILNLIPLWQSDLNLLRSARVEALTERPKILSFVANNIFIKIIELERLNSKYEKCAFSSLREYEPFIKYLMLNEPIVLAAESTKLTKSGQMISPSISSAIELSAEPEFDFLKLTLSQATFKKRIINVLDNYRSARTKLRQMVERTDDLIFGIAKQSVNTKVMNDLLVINSELSSLRKQASKRSKYLSLTFSGLSMLPVPFVSQLLNLLGMGSGKISEIIESGALANRGLSPNGLSAYYYFLESNINFSKLERFPEVEKENKKLDSNFFEDPFWRAWNAHNKAAPADARSARDGWAATLAYKGTLLPNKNLSQQLRARIAIFLPISRWLGEGAEMSEKDSKSSNNRLPSNAGALSSSGSNAAAGSAFFGGMSLGAAAGGFIGGTLLGPLGAIGGAKFGSTIGTGLGLAFSGVIDLFFDNVYVKNDYTEDIVVALHYMTNDTWKSHYWVLIGAGQKELVASLRLESKYIYVHAHAANGTNWGRDNVFQELDGHRYQFSQYDTDTSRGDFTITLRVRR